MSLRRPAATAVSSSNDAYSSSSSRMRASSSSSPRFPLPENAFGPLHLTSTQIKAFEAQVQALVAKTLREYERFELSGQAVYASDYDVVGMEDGITALRKRDGSASTRTECRVMGNVNADYRHLMDLHYAETSKELYEWLQFMHHHTIDAHVLRTFETATPENPHHYFGIKWTVFQASVFASKIDQCFVEYMTYRKDLRGRDVGVRVTLPVQLVEVDHAMDAMKVKRVSSQMVQIMRPVYSESHRSTTHMFVAAENEYPHFVPTSLVRTLTDIGKNLPMCIDSARINRRGLVSEKLWVPNTSRRGCVVCTRTFGAARGRHHCRLCGDVICRKCMLVRDTAEYSSPKVFKVVKTKFCVMCITKLREPEVVDLSASLVGTQSKSGYKQQSTELDIEFAPTDFDEGSRISQWSEAESEDYQTETSEPSDSARSSLTSVSEQGSDKLSFAARLQELAERIEDAVIEEATVPSEPEPANRETEGDVIVIDTKDMLRENHHHSHHQFQDFDVDPLASSGVYSPERRRSSNPLSQSRSIDQCLAEQEALLRQMVMVSQAHSSQHQQQHHRRGSQTPPQNEPYYEEYDT